MPATWLQLAVKAPSSASDAIANFLIERGSPGVVLKKGQVQAFFPSPMCGASFKRDIRRFLFSIRELYSDSGEPELHWTVLKDKNWSSSWRRFFRPQKIGRGLIVAPSWCAVPKIPGRKVIVIEPGMAFGTGTHATTRSCLELLERVTRTLPQGNFAALDVGTGSGILAIALARLGATQVLALDIDPVALDAARANVRRNRAQGIIRLSGSALSQIHGSFRIVVANLTAETIVRLTKSLNRKVSPGGYLILSGILQPKAAEVISQFAPSRFRLASQVTQKDWTTLLLKKKG